MTALYILININSNYYIYFQHPMYYNVLILLLIVLYMCIVNIEQVCH